MAVSKGFLAHALDLLSLAGPVTARSMFGGYGLYLGGSMFGLLDDDDIFLKTDELSRGAFVTAGCRQWVYPSPKGPMPTSSYRPPDDALEHAEAMLPWARLALEAAERAAAKKAAKKTPASGAKGANGAKKAGARPAKKASAAKASGKKGTAGAGASKANGAKGAGAKKGAGGVRPEARRHAATSSARTR
jgi:DNA transformation protein